MSPQLWWYLARASGLVAWVLLCAGLVLGVLLTTRALRPADRPAWLLAVHRAVSGGAVSATALHLATLVADTYVHFGWLELLVPGASAWRPLAVGVGIVALYLLVAIEVTSVLMRRLPRRWWQWVHRTSYATVWAATVHAGLAGTDAPSTAYKVVALVLSIAVVWAALVRVLFGRSVAGRRSASAGSQASSDRAAAVADPPRA